MARCGPCACLTGEIRLPPTRVCILPKGPVRRLTWLWRPWLFCSHTNTATLPDTEGVCQAGPFSLVSLVTPLGAVRPPGKQGGTLALAIARPIKTEATTVGAATR